MTSKLLRAEKLMTIFVVLIAVFVVFWCFHTFVKRLTSPLRGYKGPVGLCSTLSSWADSCVWQVDTKKPPPRNRVNISHLFLCFRGRWKSIWRDFGFHTTGNETWSSQRQRTRNPRSCFLSTYIHPLVHRWLVKTVCKDLSRYWQGFLGAPLLSQLLFRSSPPRHWDFIIVWISNDPSEFWNSHCCTPNPLFACNIRFTCLCVFHSGIPPSQPLFRFLFFHYLPPREPLLNKQTSPLPLDTQLCCGDLLRLSGRILSNAVASVNKRKARKPEGWRICSKCGLSPSRHCAFPPLSGV